MKRTNCAGFAILALLHLQPFAQLIGAVCAVCAGIHCLYIKLNALRCLLH